MLCAQGADSYSVFTMPHSPCAGWSSLGEDRLCGRLKGGKVLPEDKGYMYI